MKTKSYLIITWFNSTLFMRKNLEKILNVPLFLTSVSFIFFIPIVNSLDWIKNVFKEQELSSIFSPQILGCVINTSNFICMFKKILNPIIVDLQSHFQSALRSEHQLLNFFCALPLLSSQTWAISKLGNYNILKTILSILKLNLKWRQ